jgi:hypothetical protein
MTRLGDALQRTAGRQRYLLLKRHLRQRRAAAAQRQLNAPMPSVVFHSAMQTLTELEHRVAAPLPLVYLRFGDGDANLLLGQDDLYQPWSPSIAIEMAEAFALRGPGIMKSLPLHSPRWGHDEGMAPGFHLSTDEWAEDILRAVAPFVYDEDVWSPVALSFAVAYDPPRVGRFLGSIGGHRTALVTDHAIALELATLLAPGSVINAPSANVFACLDQLETQTLEAIAASEAERVIIAVGCAGRVMTKRLMLRVPHLQIIDPGSILDGLVGRQSRAWMAPRFVPPESWGLVRQGIAASLEA